MYISSRSLRAELAAVALSFANQAAADIGHAFIMGTSPDRLVVLSNGQNYTKLDYTGFFAVGGRLEFDVRAVGGVKSWSAWPIVASTYPTTLYLPGTKEMAQSKNYAVGHRPDEVGKNLTFQFPAPYLKTVTTDMCRALAEDLRNGGMSDQEIFGKNRDLVMKISLNAKVDSTGAGQGDQIWEHHAPHEVTVRCAKFAGAQLPQGGDGGFAADPKVETATMQLSEQTTKGGLCRVKTVTAIRGNTAGMTVKYRFVHSSGEKSNVFTTKTEANRIAVVNHNWDIPNGAGAETGWVRIEGVTPGFSSNKADYSMDCTDAGGGGDFKADAANVIKSTMKLTEIATANGVCKVKLVTAISADTANATITYRYVHSSGKKSKVFTTKTAANKIAVVTKEWNVPNGAGAESGWFWIEGVSTSFASNKAAYGMTCKGKIGGGLTLGN